MSTQPNSDAEIESTDGTRLVVRRVGTGDPVVTVHGSGGGLHSWAAVADLLASDHEVWLWARRGYGPGDVPADPPTSFADDTADLLAVVDAAHTVSGRSVHVVGASYGATLALHAARADARHLRSLAVYEPPLFAAGPALVPLLERYRTALDRDDARSAGEVLNEVTHVPQAIVDAFAAAAPESPPDPVEARRSTLGWRHDLEALAGDGPDVARWSAIGLPTLIMQGADTWEPMPSTMDALARALPHAPRITWEGQMHFATSTAPQVVADTLQAFFASVA